MAGDNGSFETIQTTDEHPLFVRGRGWVAASDLVPGEAVQETDGSWQLVRVSNGVSLDEPVTVYNFEVEEDHTYFVSDGVGAEDAVWVHNSIAGTCAIPKAADLGIAKSAAKPDRPYQQWKLFIQELMDSKAPSPDPQGVPGALRWDVPGGFNGSHGTYQLVVDPQRNLILHYLFKSN